MTSLRFSVFALFTAAALASPVSPACGSGTLSSYEALTNGCTIGSQPTFTFSNFGFTASVLYGSPTLLTAGQIGVAPSNPASNALDFDFSSSGFQVAAGQGAQYVISYNIDPPPPEILHFGSDLDPPATSGLAEVTTELCVNGFFSGGVCSSGVTKTLTIYTSGSSEVLSDSVSFSGAVSKLGVIDTITLEGSGGAASIPVFGNDTTTSVPEPASGLIGACALALGALLMRCVKAKVG